MTGKPTPGRCEVRAYFHSSFLEEVGTRRVLVRLSDRLPPHEVERLRVGWNAIVEAEAAGYDGLEAVKALPEAMQLLREISNWLVCLPIAGPEGLAEAAPDFQEQTDNLLSRLTKKESPNDAA